MPDGHSHNFMNPHAASVAPSEFAKPVSAGDLTPALRVMLAGKPLSADQTAAAFEAMMTGQVSHGEVGAFLALLAARCPVSAEIVGAAKVMRAHVDRVCCRIPPDRIIDTAGTGGAPKTFNVSTAAAIVAAAVCHPRGMVIAKHGNRSRTGRGSAEVLEHLGVNIDADRAAQARCLEQCGVCFCFAIHHHPATRHVMPVRKALGFPTIFNLLGPLTNPAGARRQVMGVYDRRYLQPIAEALRDLGAVRAMVVHSNDGLDELSISASTNAFHVHGGDIHEEVISPKMLGLRMSAMESVVADSLADAATMISRVINGIEQGPPRDMTLLNAAATLLVADAADSLGQGVELAAKAIDSGQARRTLEQLITQSRAT